MKQEYEYLVESVYDEWRGGTNINKFQEVLNLHASQGWRLITAITNELGKNSTSLNGFGVNSTQDQTILIFERPNMKNVNASFYNNVYENLNKQYYAVKIEKIEIKKNDINETTCIGLSGKLNKGINLSAIKVNVVFESYWGECKSECLIFDKIDVNSMYGFKTEYIVIKENILKSLKSVKATIVQYINGEELCENEAYEQQILEDTKTSDASFMVQYIDKIESMTCVREMRDFLTNQNIRSDEFLNIILPKMDEFIIKERMYGSLSDSFVKWLKENVK